MTAHILGFEGQLDRWSKGSLAKLRWAVMSCTAAAPQTADQARPDLKSQRPREHGLQADGGTQSREPVATETLTRHGEGGLASGLRVASLSG